MQKDNVRQNVYSTVSAKRGFSKLIVKNLHRVLSYHLLRIFFYHSSNGKGYHTVFTGEG